MCQYPFRRIKGEHRNGKTGTVRRIDDKTINNAYETLLTRPSASLFSFTAFLPPSSEELFDGVRLIFCVPFGSVSVNPGEFEMNGEAKVGVVS